MSTSNESKFSRFILAAAVSVPALGGLAWVVSGDDAERGEDAAATAPELPRGRVVLEGRGDAAPGPCTFTAGTRMAYDVEVGVQSRLDSSSVGEGLDGSPSFSPHVTTKDADAQQRWHVDLESLGDASDGSAVLAARILDQHGASGSSVGETFLVRLGSHCDVQEFAWRTEGDLGLAKHQQQMLAGLGWVAPREGEHHWTGTLLDSLGRIHAGFEREDEVVRGRVVSFGELFGQGPDDAEFEVERSSIEVTPRAGEWFGELSVERSLRLRGFGRTVGAMSSSLHASRAEPGAWRPTVSASDGGWSWGLLLDRVDIAGSGGLEGSELAGVPVERTMSDYLALLKEQGKPAARAMLVEWLQANPSGATEVLAQLQAGWLGDDKDAASAVIDALGQAQTPAAGEALVALVDDSQDPRYAIMATWSLSKVREPTAAMVEAMASAARRGDLPPDVRRTVQLSLGSFAKSNTERSPEISAMAREQIEGWLEAPADANDLASSLLAAGNAGHDQMAPAIDPYLEHEDPRIRKNAARALRHMSSEEAYPRLTPRMDDQDPGVRASALEAMTKVAKANGASLPPSAVGRAIELLDDRAVEREQKAVLDLLSYAAKRGDDEARSSVQERFDRALRDGNDGKLRALGTVANTRWTAE